MFSELQGSDYSKRLPEIHRSTKTPSSTK